MSKNIVYLGKSLDGYIAGKNGELDWLDMVPNPNQDDMGFNAFMDDIDALVMGRNTFEMVLSFGVDWPYKKHVFVLSGSLKEIPKGLAGKVSIVQGTLSEVLEAIHSKGHHKLYIDGGKTVQAFLAENLIDELILTTIPIILGDGIPLFGVLPKF